MTHARKFWLPDDHVRSIAYEYGLPAGLPDREIEKVYEWVTVSVDPSPDDDPALRVAEVSEASTEASPEPEPEAESLPDEIVKAYMEILGIGSPTLRERKIKEAAARFGISVLTVKAEISEMRKREKTSSAQPEDTTYIDGSVRQGRATERVTKWVKAAADALEGVEAEVVDLKELAMPMFDEPILPMMNKNRQPTGGVKTWLDALESADGLVVVTPEYNHAMPSGLKNAIDYINFQVMHKPFLVVSHGANGGARSMEQV